MPALWTQNSWQLSQGVFAAIEMEGQGQGDGKMFPLCLSGQVCGGDKRGSLGSQDWKRPFWISMENSDSILGIAQSVSKLWCSGGGQLLSPNWVWGRTEGDISNVWKLSLFIIQGVTQEICINTDCQWNSGLGSVVGERPTGRTTNRMWNLSSGLKDG